MKIAALSCVSGQTIPLRACEWKGRVMIECFDPAGFLREVAGLLEASTAYPPGAWVRGVVIHGEGAYFDLLDALGTCVSEILHLDASDAQVRILDQLIWEVKLN